MAKVIRRKLMAKDDVKKQDAQDGLKIFDLLNDIFISL